MDFHLSARGPDRNYTGVLTKTIVYMGTLVVFLVCEYSNAPGGMYGTTDRSISILFDNIGYCHSKMDQLP